MRLLSYIELQDRAVGLADDVEHAGAGVEREASRSVQAGGKHLAIPGIEDQQLAISRRRCAEVGAVLQKKELRVRRAAHPPCNIDGRRRVIDEWRDGAAGGIELHYSRTPGVKGKPERNVTRS